MCVFLYISIKLELLTLCRGDQELHINDASSNIRVCKLKKLIVKKVFDYCIIF